MAGYFNYTVDYIHFLYFNIINLFSKGLRSRMPFPGNRIFPQKNPGSFPSRAFWKILFPVPSQSRLSPVSVPKMKREFPNLKFCISISEIPKIQYCSGIFLLSTENSYTHLYERNCVSATSLKRCYFPQAK